MQVTPFPTAAQRHWMKLGFGMFIHFGINTFYDTEWSDGSLDPAAFNPVNFDPDQWCRVASEAGMKFVVLVTKHHDGFCNWPTRYTDYSVSSTPFKRDVVGEVVTAARKYGLEVGLYYSLWDRHEKSHDADEARYVDFMMGQISELLTNYGPIVELWFDGMWVKYQVDWKPLTRETFAEGWRQIAAPRWGWDTLYGHIKSLQPDCLVLNNSTAAFPGVPLFPCDARTGEKATKLTEDKPIWSDGVSEKYLPLQIETTMSRKGRAGQFPNGSWFWHAWDDSVASQEQILEWIALAKQREAVLLLNCGPTAEGLLREVDVAVLSSLRTTAV